jgi:hypothetical protein
VNLLRLGHLELDLFIETLVLGQAKDIVHLLVLLAVPHDLVAAKRPALLA